MSMKVCSNHFVQGYRTSECPTATLYMRRYDCESKSAPKIRSIESKEKKSRKRKVIVQMKFKLRKCPLWMRSRY